MIFNIYFFIFLFNFKARDNTNKNHNFLRNLDFRPTKPEYVVLIRWLIIREL